MRRQYCRVPPALRGKKERPKKLNFGQPLEFVGSDHDQEQQSAAGAEDAPAGKAAGRLGVGFNEE
jgi:hypothetical protein